MGGQAMYDDQDAATARAVNASSAIQCYMVAGQEADAARITQPISGPGRC